MNFAPESSPEPEPVFLQVGGFNIRLAPEHSLWSHCVWNSSKRLAKLIEDGTIQVAGKAVIELGCGAAIPSLTALKHGASRVVACEYPDKELIDNVQFNFQRNLTPEELGKAEVRPHIWGREPMEPEFDLMFQADLVFNHIEHKNLLLEIQRCLRPGGQCHVLYSHHRPHLKRRDDAFMQLCIENGLNVEQRETVRMERMFPDDDSKYPIADREPVFWYVITHKLTE